MDVREGYKVTEVGVVPQDWSVLCLGEFSVVSAGGTPSRNNSLFWDGDIPWVTTTEVDWCVIRESIQMISVEGLRNSPARMLSRGTLLLALYGQGKTRGKVAILGLKAATNQACAAISIQDNVCSLYVFYSLQYRYEEIRSLSNSGSQDNLNSALVRSILLPMPNDVNEQQAIAEALSDADALIESLEQLIVKKQLIKQGAMQELLTGKRRLPGFVGEWVVKPLCHLAKITSGGTPSTRVFEYWNGSIPWCTPTDITKLCGAIYLEETSRYITQVGLDSSSAELLPAGSVLMTSRATIGECAMVRRPVSTNQGFKNFIPKVDVNSTYLFFLLSSLKDDFMKLCVGSTFLEIGKSELADFEVIVPSMLEEQDVIAQTLTDIDTEITELESRLTKARQIKQGMMQELLTGRIRLMKPTVQTV